MPLLLQEKWGPLPIWAWTGIGAAGVAILLWRMKPGTQQDQGYAAGFDAGASSFQPPAAPAPAGQPPIIINFPAWPSNPPPIDHPGAPITPFPGEPGGPPLPTTPKPPPAVQPDPTPVNYWQQLSGYWGEAIFRTAQQVDLRLRRITTMDQGGTFKVDLAGIVDWNVIGEGTVDATGTVRRSDGSLLGILNPTQWAALLRGGNPAPNAPVTPADLAFGQTRHGEAIIDFNGAPVRATRIGDVSAAGDFDVLLGNTRDWTDFGRAHVDALGNVIVGGRTIYRLAPSNLAALLQGTWPPPSGVGTAGTTVSVAAA